MALNLISPPLMLMLSMLLNFAVLRHASQQFINVKKCFFALSARSISALVIRALKTIKKLAKNKCVRVHARTLILCGFQGISSAKNRARIPDKLIAGIHFLKMERLSGS